MKMCRCMIVVNDENVLFKLFVFLNIWYFQASVSRQRNHWERLLYASHRMLVISCQECKTAECEFWGLGNGVAENSVPFMDVTLRRWVDGSWRWSWVCR